MKQYTLLTVNGINKLLKIASNGSKIILKEVVVSDFDGELSESITTIPNEKYRGAINAITINESDSNILDVDAIIPPEVGGFYIKTAGIYCDDGSLFAVARLPDTYKPLLSEGSSKDITLSFRLQIANANDSIVLKVDNNVVLATRKWSENQFLKKTDKIDAYTKAESDDKFVAKTDKATETKAGITKLKNTITAKQEDVAVTEKAVAEAIEANKGLGIGQEYKNVTSQKRMNENYENTTNKPIYLYLVINNAYKVNFDVLINNKKILTHDEPDRCIINFIVPPKATYKIIPDSDRYAIVYWAELR
ncbi:hypothetical protein B9N63_06145 [Campylobacter concisus]|uniref:phage tail protein n=1 Tax=Campylobacter concisus TaxID=199 RepID=UPI000B3D5DC1|nr:phage tail protein [Campylobacter concisus]OUT13600.1 hypothetical protein B9N63_06145 [Campylobacter concisus]